MHRFSVSKPIYRLMFILTSLWEVAVCRVTFADLVVLGAHNRKLLTSCSNWAKTSRVSFRTVFPALYFQHQTFSECFYRIEKFEFAERNFWIAYKEARSPGFFCLVWRRWFATGLPSPFPLFFSLRNYLILWAVGTFVLVSNRCCSEFYPRTEFTATLHLLCYCKSVTCTRSETDYSLISHIVLFWWSCSSHVCVCFPIAWVWLNQRLICCDLT